MPRQKVTIRVTRAGQPGKVQRKFMPGEGSPGMRSREISVATMGSPAKASDYTLTKEPAAESRS